MTEGGDLDKLGRGALWRNELEGCLHQNHVFALRPLPGKVEPRYLALTTQSLYARHYFESTGTKTTNLASTNKSKILDFPIPLPPLEEQRRIADFLDAETARIDRIVQLREDASSLLKQRERALLDSEVESLALRFGVLPLRRFICGIEQGTSPQCDNAPAGLGEWGVLKVSAVKGGRFFGEQNKRLPEEMDPESQYEVHDGDFLITRANTPALVGAAAVAERPRRRLILCDKIFRVRVSENVLKKYLVLVAQGTRIRDLCAEGSHGTSQSMANLKTDEIKRWPIPVAPLKEQEALVERCESVLQISSELIASIGAQVGLSEERRRAVVTAAVTGELDVTTARRVT
ncbi:hypothetical protein GCM10022254_68560 [Actinomadura meridiana]|uniref:Type I restriction modification DNA specificity domain-containing protein n=2 Tax=Actinomadura meridiana TaxID=559626 RepID=A0ABP8CMH7_9ACTN